MTLRPGTRLGTYEIVSPLGAGGMGEVYRARDLRLGREVAVKVLPADMASSPDRLARFEREARAVAGLNHPNIVVLHSVEDEDGIRFLTMELIEGKSLATLLTPGGLPLSRCLDLLIPLADALVAAHERGVIHRDLKPGNVMVTRDGRVKVLDFGLAKIAAGEAREDGETLALTAGLSRDGEVFGTVPYMAPEQVRGEAVDARTDLFALGVMLYELATGRRPFSGSSIADTSSAILRDKPKPLSSLRADLPGDLDRIAERCLEKDPRARFQTALDLGNELRHLKLTLERGVAATVNSHGLASIAVLPFVNRSRNEEDEYFSDGLADELLNMLTKIRGLRVAARSSAFTFKGRPVTVGEVGRSLNVATVLEGSVRKAGSHVRISVQLVNVADGYDLWSETYDRTLEDIFAVQDDIAQSVVTKLRTTLLGEKADSKVSDQVEAEVASAAKGRAEDPEAHRLYLQGRHFIEQFTREDVAKGIGYLREALELDPGYAVAWAELGGAYWSRAAIGWVPAEEGYARGREAVERALSLEPDLAEGHKELGWIQSLHDWDWRGAQASFRRALELAPGNASVLRGAGWLARCLGRVEEAIRLARRALDQDPLSSSSHNNLGYMLRIAGRLTEAEEMYRKALELAPQRTATHASYALVLLAKGRKEEALREAMREPDELVRLWALAVTYHGAGREHESDEALRDLTERGAGTSACQIADAHAVRGEADLAFEWLERAYEQRDGGLVEIKANPNFRSLHDDPRWAAFMKKMGFDELSSPRHGRSLSG